MICLRVVAVREPPAFRTSMVAARPEQSGVFAHEYRSSTQAGSYLLPVCSLVKVLCTAAAFCAMIYAMPPFD